MKYYNMPAFSDSSAILIDVNKINGKFGTFVRITNYSEFKTLEFEVFVHSPLSSSWKSLGKKYCLTLMTMPILVKDI